MERTAVDWLFTTLDNILELYPSEWGKVSKAVEEAKAMEKEQIEMAYQADRYPCSDEDAQQYYKETYNK